MPNEQCDTIESIQEAQLKKHAFWLVEYFTSIRVRDVIVVDLPTDWSHVSDVPDSLSECKAQHTIAHVFFFFYW